MAAWINTSWNAAIWSSVVSVASGSLICARNIMRQIVYMRRHAKHATLGFALDVEKHKLECRCMSECRFCGERILDYHMPQHAANCTQAIQCDGCHARIRASELKEHKLVCRCINKCRFCGNRFSDYQLPQHESSCPRAATCEGCLNRVSLTALNDHKLTCRSMSDCRFCGGRFPDTRRKQHEATCAYGKACEGCHRRIRIVDLESHKAECRCMSNCRFCGVRFPDCVKSQHEATCLHGTTCEGCRSRVRTADIDKHRLGCRYMSDCRFCGKRVPDTCKEQHETHCDKRQSSRQSTTSSEKPSGVRDSPRSFDFDPVARGNDDVEKTLRRIRYDLSTLDRAGRKRYLRGLQLQYHPDKQSGDLASASEVFHFVQSHWDAEFK